MAHALDKDLRQELFFIEVIVDRERLVESMEARVYVKVNNRNTRAIQTLTIPNPAMIGFVLAEGLSILTKCKTQSWFGLTVMKQVNKGINYIEGDRDTNSLVT